MLRRMAVIVAILVAGICAVIGFLQAAAYQEVFPLGTNDGATVQWGPGMERQQLLAELKEIAEREDLVVLLAVPDPKDYLHGVEVYSLGARQPDTAKPIVWVDPNRLGGLHPGAEIGNASLNGYYMLSGTDRAITTFKTWLNQRGAAVNGNDLTPLTLVLGQFFRGGVVLLLLAAAVLGIVVAMAWYSAKAESRAIRLIAGVPAGRIHLQDLLGLFFSITIPLLIVTAATALVFGIWRGAENTVMIASFAVPCLLGWLLVVGVISLLLSALVKPDPTQIAQRVPQVIRFQFVGQFLKTVALSLTLASLPALILLGAEAVSKSAAQARIAPLRNYVSISLKNNPSSSESEAHIAALVRDMDQSRQLAFGAALNREDLVLKEAGYDGIVLVNERYLQLMGAESLISKPVSGAFYDRLIYPIGGAFRVDSTAGENQLSIHEFQGSEGIVVQTGGGERGGMVFLNKPLVLVTQDVHKSFSDGSLVSFLTTENITFADSESLLKGIRKHDLSQVFGGVQRVTDSALLYAQFLYRSAVTMILTTGVLVAAVVLSLMVTARIYAIRNARRIFVYRSQGNSWNVILARRMAIELMLVLMVSVVVVVVSGYFGVALGWALPGPLIYLALSWLTHVRASQAVFEKVTHRVY